MLKNRICIKQKPKSQTSKMKYELQIVARTRTARFPHPSFREQSTRQQPNEENQTAHGKTGSPKTQSKSEKEGEGRSFLLMSRIRMERRNLRRGTFVALQSHLHLCSHEATARPPSLCEMEDQDEREEGNARLKSPQLGFVFGREREPRILCKGK
ncbi:hypothetical protein LR48_Vigan561s006600 [Vigna angularis]|uniref:Uncharacterized protein n=2 Tax=Phaseolus angularis TaxID=3914 RepID=A0A0L9TE56_PHAAN|nr:hypothetical protein LR48_Vigan561s006600 [Vigna angularis]BAT78292.1 hypothetical protein VIGAN_02095100 [Vigna angularis var. angularis]